MPTQTQSFVSKGTNDKPSVKRERILVIEDEADIADLLKFNLKKEGFRAGNSCAEPS